ncbi:MAG: transcription termination factor NusA [Planctomycetota bacterium]
MNGELLRIVDTIHRDKAIDKETIFQDIEAAFLSAARKRFGAKDSLTIQIDRKTGNIIALDGDQEIDPGELGRIAAQTFRQVMIQKIREAERNALYTDFEARQGDILTGSVLRVEGTNVIVNLGKVEAVLPRSEQVPGESYKVGERIRAHVLEVRKKGQKVRVVLSRASKDFVRRLFELEVPELADKTIEIREIAREAGFRSKIAVVSLTQRVDAVGACVGVRGSRIKNIIEELNGEKVDIIRWDDNEEALIKNALKPAEVDSVTLDPESRRAQVVVARDQLSLAIGKGGQNVRLASRLADWDIDVMSNAPDEDTPRPEETPLRDLPGVVAENSGVLREEGIRTVGDVLKKGLEALENLSGITPEKSQGIWDAVNAYFSAAHPPVPEPDVIEALGATTEPGAGPAAQEAPAEGVSQEAPAAQEAPAEGAPQDSAAEAAAQEAPAEGAPEDSAAEAAASEAPAEGAAAGVPSEPSSEGEAAPKATEGDAAPGT